MDAETAKILERFMGPLVASGVGMGVAERVAKRRAFEAGEWDGEICERCGRRDWTLWSWDRVGLCSRCHEAKGVPGRDPAMGVNDAEKTEA